MAVVVCVGVLGYCVVGRLFFACILMAFIGLVGGHFYLWGPFVALVSAFRC